MLPATPLTVACRRLVGLCFVLFMQKFSLNVIEFPDYNPQHKWGYEFMMLRSEYSYNFSTDSNFSKDSKHVAVLQGWKKENKNTIVEYFPHHVLFPISHTY